MTDTLAAADDENGTEKGPVKSVARLDDPRILRRKLQDNVGEYEVEAVGIIKHTHRFRALADFYWDMRRSDFAQRYADQVFTGDGKTHCPLLAPSLLFCSSMSTSQFDPI